VEEIYRREAVNQRFDKSNTDHPLAFAGQHPNQSVKTLTHATLVSGLAKAAALDFAKAILTERINVRSGVGLGGGGLEAWTTRLLMNSGGGAETKPVMNYHREQRQPLFCPQPVSYVLTRSTESRWCRLP
jgi:hypothetical protein